MDIGNRNIFAVTTFVCVHTQKEMPKREQNVWDFHLDSFFSLFLILTFRNKIQPHWNENCDKKCSLFQGNTGIWLAIVVILFSSGVVLIVSLSAIGVCERCKMDGGGVYFLISHVLGGRIGGSVGVMYCFSQVIISLNF